MTTEILDRLCALYGIASEYIDVWGHPHPTPTETQQALLAAMGLSTATTDWQALLQERERRAWERLLPPVVVSRGPGAPVIPLHVPLDQADQALDWTLLLENGQRSEGRLRPAELAVLATHDRLARYGFTLPVTPEPGYHRFALTRGDQPPAALRLIVAPERCYQPPVLADGGRVWGLALQLYALRSQRNWGIGDCSDLKAVVENAAGLGAALVGLNPLHALFPHNPAHTSPYSPSSRLFLNIFYLDVEAVPEFADCQAAREAVDEPQFQARLRALRAADLVDYPAVIELKLAILERLYRHFRERHLHSDGDSSIGKAFREFQRAQGESLRQQALFEALQEHFHRDDPQVWGWPVWPEPYRRPDSPEVAGFAEGQRERVEFYEYLQWRVAEQLDAAGRRAREVGLGIGLYEDLAVSVSRGGAEVWAHQDLYAFTASVGAPPDEFNRKGQNWDLPPLIPDRLYETGYELFIHTLRRNMRNTGALRIDHAMGLLRLYWVPPAASPADGAYVHYPFQDLLGILALESQRNRCLVVGEALGTVPEEVRRGLTELGVLSYRLLYFERDEEGGFKLPAEYPAQALVAITTHDLPTLNGYWQGADLTAREELNLFPTQAVRDAEIVKRAQDRALLRVSLEKEGLLPAAVSVHSVSMPEATPELSRAVHRYLARSPAQVMMVQMEDVFGQVQQVNMPGTTDQYPNWRRKLPLNLEEWPADPRLRALTEALAEERGVAPPSPAAPPAERRPAGPRIPEATYRLQFNSGFTFAQATAIVPYLQALGISHCYASPYLKARPGSTHGYDIIDHNALNPEIGSREAFDAFSEALRRHGLGQVLDIVPNHMGVMGSDNAWWLDVLENGPAAVHAPFFDIEWQPLKDELRNKLLLPVLGDQYGVVLEKGELKLSFDPDSGAFSVQYYDHRFPIDPREYPRLLGHRIEQLGQRLGTQDAGFLEYQSLVTALGYLPERTETAPDRLAERNRDKEIHKRHLAELGRKSPDIAWFMEENLRLFNGTAGEPQSFDHLHELLEAQAYRLAFWRAAADDINYRRFFDINDLAGLRTENENVFRETHRLLAELVAEGRLDGLRIDHPDGLYHPRQYFQRLQHALTAPAAVATAQPTEPQNKSLYVVVEKILETYERLPEDWPIHGTTGYDFANLVNALLVDAEAEAALDRIYAEFIGEALDFEELLYECKKLIMRVSLTSELNVLTYQLSRIAQANRRTRDFTLSGLRTTLEEIVACFPVYRTYVTPEGASEEDRRYVDWAVSKAKKRTQADISIFDFVRDVLLTVAAEGKPAAFREAVVAFAMKFQQYTGPLMAKGLEDTAFYRYHRLVSLNEVGGDPRRFATSVNGFHQAVQVRARAWPQAMLSTSTHDSKRSEDVRARIDVLSELADDWDRHLKRWSRINKNKKRLVDDRPAPSANDEYLLYQTLLGAWPLEGLDEAERGRFRERIENYMLKAIKEAKLHSSWINPNPGYEEAVVAFVRALLEPEKNRFLEDFLPFQGRIARFGLFNSLTQTLLKLTVPGVPDIYQGNELWDFSLVDPDNRRAVDYARREALLRELQVLAGGPDEELAARVRGLLDSLEDGRVKLYLTWRTLQLRREQPALFREGDYTALTAEGFRAEHVCAFARRYEDREAVVVAPLLFAKLREGRARELPLGEAVWEDTRLLLPDAEKRGYLNVFTRETVVAAEREGTVSLPLGRVLAHFPVALLVRQ